MKKLCMILPLALILCFMVGCQNKEAMAELEEFKDQAEVEEQNIALVKLMWEAWNKGDIEAYKEIVAPKSVYYAPSSTPEPMSREETIEGRNMILKVFPDSRWITEELFASGDRVITRYIYEGTHEGEFMGIPPTRNLVEFSGIVIARIENGKIVEERCNYDDLGAMMQLGMELKPKEEK